MLERLRKFLGDPPAASAAAAPKPSAAASQPPAPVGTTPAPAGKPSGTANQPSGTANQPSGTANQPSETAPKAFGTAAQASGTPSVPSTVPEMAFTAHQVRHTAQEVRHGTGEVRHETGGKPFGTVVSSFETVVKPSPPAPNANTTVPNASSTVPNAFPTPANAFPTASDGQPAVSNVFPAVPNPISPAVNASSTVSNAKSAVPNALPTTANASPTVPDAKSPAPAAPDRPAKLPAGFADPAGTVFLPRDDVKLQPPHIAVTVPASAVVSLPADKVKATSAQPAASALPLPAGEGRGEGERLPTSVAAGNTKTPTASPSPQPSPPGGEGARSTANVPHGVPPSGGAASPPPKGGTPSPAPAPTAPKPATWKNLPAKEPWCPPAIAAQAPGLAKIAAADAIAFERVLPGWRAAGASRRGRMHANAGTHREDALAFDAHERATVICVSDGAGSCVHSRIGSHVAAQRVVEFLLAATASVDAAIAGDATKLKDFLAAQVTAAAVAATDALVELARKSGAQPKEFRCTLLTALHYRGAQHELLLTNQIGDGAICLLRTDKTTARLGASDSGTHSGEVSCFVPDDCARVKAKVVEVTTDVPSVECVLLCSDGIEDPFYPLEKQAGEIFRQFYTGVTAPLPDFKAQLPQPAPLLQESAAWGLAQWLEFEKRGENDDRTVAVLHRLPVNVGF